MYIKEEMLSRPWFSLACMMVSCRYPLELLVLGHSVSEAQCHALKFRGPWRYFTWRFSPGCNIIFQVNEWVTLNFVAQVTLPGECSPCQTWPNCRRHRWKSLNQVAPKLRSGNNKLLHCLSSGVGLLHSKEHWTIQSWTSNHFRDWHSGRVIVWLSQEDLEPFLLAPSFRGTRYGESGVEMTSWDDVRVSHSLPSSLPTWLTPPSSAWLLNSHKKAIFFLFRI